MPPLKNITKEMFAREIIKQNGNTRKAYQKIYKSDDLGNPYHALTNDVRNRISEILNNTKGLNIEDLNRKLQSLLDYKKPLVVGDSVEYFDDGNVQTANLTLAYKLHGLLQNNVVDNSVKIQHNSVTQINQLSQFNDNLQKISELSKQLSYNKLSGKVKVNDNDDINDSNTQIIDVK